MERLPDLQRRLAEEDPELLRLLEEAARSYELYKRIEAWDQHDFIKVCIKAALKKP